MKINSLTQTIRSQKMTEDFLLVAEARIKRGDTYGAIEAVIRAVRNQKSAINNVSRLAFNRKAKGGKR